MKTANDLIAAALDGLRPLSALDLASWAEENIRLGPQHGRPGRFRVTPQLKGVFESLSDPEIRETVVVKPSRVGGSLAAGVVVAATAMRQPVPILFLTGTAELASTAMRDLENIVSTSPSLEGLLPTPTSKPAPGVKAQYLDRDLSSGGRITYLPATVNSLRGRAGGLIVRDELSSWSDDKEGDVLQLSENRAISFGKRAKLLSLSTPLVTDDPIVRLYEQTDQRKMWVGCLHCDGSFVMDHTHFVFDFEGDGSDAGLACPHCGSHHGEEDKLALLDTADWRPTAKGDPSKRGFHLSAIQSTFVDFQTIAQEWIKARQGRDMRAFYNTVLALPADEATDPEEDKALVIAAAVDVDPDGLDPEWIGLSSYTDAQIDRFETLICAHNEQGDILVLDHLVTTGDTGEEATFTELTHSVNSWNGLPHKEAGPGALKLFANGLDCGFRQSILLPLVNRHGRLGWRGTKGRGGDFRAVNKTPTHVKGEGYLFTLGVNTLKSEVWNMLQLGRIQISRHLTENPDFVAQFASEIATPAVKDGQSYMRWHKRPSQERNEIFDVVVGNLAMQNLFFQPRTIKDRLTDSAKHFAIGEDPAPRTERQIVPRFADQL